MMKIWIILPTVDHLSSILSFQMLILMTILTLIMMILTNITVAQPNIQYSTDGNSEDKLSDGPAEDITVEHLASLP